VRYAFYYWRAPAPHPAQGAGVSPEELREVAALRVAKALFVPMSMIDGRPWVPTAAEADASDRQQSKEN
jgi:hypothetical protein